MKRNIFDLNYQAVVELFQSLDQPPYRADQLWKGLFVHFWSLPSEFTTIPATIQMKLDDLISFNSLHKEKVLHSSDGETQKILYRLADQYAIETVLMRYHKRNTICISSQVGCGMGCDFCATGQMGFKRNLTSGEIIEQVVRIAEQLDQENQAPTNVVFMGMGEPFHNYDQVLNAVKILNDPRGMNLGARRFTISTVGLVPQIYQLSKEKLQVNLAVSLHAADDELRSSMMAINRRYPLEKLFQACKYYTNKTNRRITFEWALIEGVNDSQEQAGKLVDLIGDMLAHVNVIPLNPNTHYAGEPSQPQTVQEFQQILQEAEIPCTVRLRRGIDIQAGCGQLASQV